MASTVQKIGETGFWIAGALSPEELIELTKTNGIKGHLYLCTDQGTDFGVTPMGMQTCSQTGMFEARNSIHVSFDPSDLAFSVS